MVNCRRYLNKVALPNFDGVCTTEVLPILPDEKQLDRVYLWSILISSEFVSWATTQISGANLPRLDPKLLAEYPIPLPPLPEQRRIADLLSRADRLRRLRRVGDELSDSLLQSVFWEMFEDAAHSKWEKYELGELIEGFEAGVNYLPVGEGENTSEWRVLKISAVTWGDFDPTESKAISADVEFEEMHIVRQGDLLIKPSQYN